MRQVSTEDKVALPGFIPLGTGSPGLMQAGLSSHVSAETLYGQLAQLPSGNTAPHCLYAATLAFLIRNVLKMNFRS